MSKYYKAEDVQELITACEWRMTLAKERHGEGFVDYSKQVLDVDELTKRLSELPTIEVSSNTAIRIIENECFRDDLSQEIKDYLFSDLRHKLYSEQAEVSEDCISKEFISESLIHRITELNAQGEKALPISTELIKFKKFVDGITPPHTKRGEDERIEIE